MYVVSAPRSAEVTRKFEGDGEPAAQFPQPSKSSLQRTLSPSRLPCLRRRRSPALKERFARDSERFALTHRPHYRHRKTLTRRLRRPPPPREGTKRLPLGEAVIAQAMTDEGRVERYICDNRFTARIFFERKSGAAKGKRRIQRRWKTIAASVGCPSPLLLRIRRCAVLYRRS